MTRSGRLSPRVLVLALGVPLLAVAVGLVVISLWGSELPTVVAIHWGFDDRPDGFAPLWSIPVLLVGVGLGLPALMIGSLVATDSASRFTATHRLLAALAPAMSLLIAVLAVGSLASQRGLADVRDAEGILPVLGVGFAAALLVGIATWFLLPRPAPTEVAEATAVEPLPLRDGERIAWLGVASVSRPLGVVLTLVVLAAAVAAALGVAAGGAAASALLLVPIVLVAALLTTTRFQLRADADGFRATGGFGFPRFRIPLDEITRVSVVQLSPLADFGGIGIRLSVDGRLGIVLRRGPALELRRRTGRPLVVGCDDAETAARVLATLQGAHPTPPSA